MVLILLFTNKFNVFFKYYAKLDFIFY